MAHPAGGWRRVTLDREEPEERKEPAGSAVAAGVATGTETGRPAPSDASTARGGAGTFVDRGARFEGTLRLRESFRIDSEFHGAIVSEGTVVVGEAADLVADVRAREVVIAGAVAGNVTASRSITLRAGASLCGDLEAPSIEIERGALFNGRTTMVNPVLAARARPARANEPPSDPAPGVAAPTTGAP